MTGLERTRVIAGLSDDQAGGWACVVCGWSYASAHVGHQQVGRSESGGQVFACSTGCEAEAGRRPSG